MGVAIAQDPAPVGDLEFITSIMALVKDLKGASTLVIIGAVIQAFLLFSRTTWSKFLGKSKILIVAIVSFVGIAVTGQIQGLEWSQILGDAGTLTAFQVLINQVIKQFSKSE